MDDRSAMSVARSAAEVLRDHVVLEVEAINYYFPYNAKLCINGNEYLKRQLAKRGVAFEAL